ncbi:MAG: hypothetical protein UX17_C0030G0022 [Parcubacteria group bacterium GW2011_GWC2_45_7]|nr:MAG: hypothetical protein UX17_C0030G0022 [Parcubacteria group bacterium GW2011_GWC2_45_7]KKU74016.1 MAG: hypothetical protein UX98_C0002G0046 [Parcubacteria group bacterium GW2011_GWA2_47_26]HAF64247.1 hypothetical protein [Candidatus Beckwithbacteria bacterium]
MPETETKQYGKELLSWEADEYSQGHKGLLWYFMATIAAVAFLIWAVATRNFLFAFIVIMFAVITATHALRPPMRYRIGLFERGLVFGTRLYLWKDIKNFWIVYEPPEVKTLYFDFGGLRPRLPVPLIDTDPNRVRKTLQEFLMEDVERIEEPLSDWVARVLKL